jgi:hypothetical protein
MTDRLYLVLLLLHFRPVIGEDATCFQSLVSIETSRAVLEGESMRDFKFETTHLLTLVTGRCF